MPDRATVCLWILAVTWAVPAGAQLVVINSDTTINDNSFTTGIDVVAGAGGAMTTVAIDAPAMIGATNIGDNVSVRANDDSEIDVSGGDLDGRILLLDSSVLNVSGAPTIQSGDLGAVQSRDDSRIDYSGATVSWGTDMRHGSRLVMNGGMGTQRDFIDTLEDSDTGDISSAVIEVSNVDIAGRDLLDLRGTDRVE